MVDVRVDEHKTPEFTLEQKKEMWFNALERYFGYQLRVCGYCGDYAHVSYVCSCGYDKVYADERGPNGELIEVWAKVRN